MLIFHQVMINSLDLNKKFVVFYCSSIVRVTDLLEVSIIMITIVWDFARFRIVQSKCITT